MLFNSLAEKACKILESWQSGCPAYAGFRWTKDFGAQNAAVSRPSEARESRSEII